MRDLLSRLKISDFDTDSYIDKYSSNHSALPNIALAFSGGGWRALMNGAGAVKAWDNRTPNTTAAGQLGGLLQSATYIAGISGGSWLVGSIYINNFTTISFLEDNDNGDVWEFENSILEGPSESHGIQVFNTAQYLNDIINDVQGKNNAGFNTSITDVWGRALSYQLINAPEGGPNYTWSSIALMPGFQNASQPFPLIVTDNRNPGEMIISNNASVFEINPYEMGSWDPTYYGFMPTQYLGTNMTAGSVTDGDQCVVGFDNCGFMMGTSSSLFNEFLLQSNSSGLSPGILSFLQKLLTTFSDSGNDIADWSPNPFYGWNPATNPSADQRILTMVDGGEDLQNIPFDPLIQPIRHVDVIFAIDSSADTTSGWPNGTSLVATYNRSLSAIANGTGFPSIPDENTMINLGLNSRPTFFGCNASNITQGTDVPLVVYLPNAPYTTYSNISTFQLQTNNTQRNAIITNGYNVVTMGNSTIDSDWPTCMACAILSRSFTKTNTTVPDACTQCFNKFCWDGTLNSTTPAPYEPTTALKAVDIASGSWSLNHGQHSFVAMIIALVATTFFSL